MSETTTAIYSQYSLSTNDHDQSSNYEISCDDNTVSEAHEINKLLSCDLQNRIVQVGSIIAENLFPDTKFGFPINAQFLYSSCGSFLSNGGIIDPSNFVDEPTTSAFLNLIVSTVYQFLRAMQQTSLEPLCYFSALNATQPVDGHPLGSNAGEEGHSAL